MFLSYLLYRCCLISSSIQMLLRLKCFSCVQSGTQSQSCEKLPQQMRNSSVVDCNKKYCVIRRIEYIQGKDKGKVYSFYRGCEQKPDYLNKVVSDTQFKTYHRSCTTDLCNYGNGIQAVGNNGSGGGDGVVESGGIKGGGGMNNGKVVAAMMVPGLGAAPVSFSCVKFVLIFPLLLLI
ncbi:hypothetical protein B566_EDAN002325 [Ephemera danica]|nr:hypothetical protein B566_EDAN002325 [Ephemera danica]